MKAKVLLKQRRTKSPKTEEIQLGELDSVATSFLEACINSEGRQEAEPAEQPEADIDCLENEGTLGEPNTADGRDLRA